MTTFVYDDTEVRLTGRKATREMPVAKRRRDSSGPRTDELVEITPNDIEDGSWTKFVRRTDLYEIIDDNE